MRRISALVHCLVLLVALLSLPLLTAPAAAQQSLPAAFVGRWQGTSLEFPTNALVPITIDLTGGSVGTVVGTMDLPNHGCGGTMTLQRLDPTGGWVELAVSITYGTACINGGLVTLSWQADGSLFYDWRHATVAVTASGTLTRTGGTTGGTTGGLSAGDAWCADLVTLYAGAPSLSGPWYGPLQQNLGYITRARAGVLVTDFVATAIFYNPTTSTTAPWDFGYAFRETADQAEIQQVIIDSNGNWYYAHYPYGVLASGEALSYNFSPGDPNTLDLVVDGDTAGFCLNGRFLNSVQLPPAVASDVDVVTGFFDGNMVTGRVVDYERFSVWALPAATCQWTGTWDTAFGPMRLSQSGGTVSGDYDVNQGQISGTVSGNVLRGTWNEAPSRQPPTDAGDVEFTMRDDCQSFTGQWRYGSSGQWSTDWSGQRVSN